MLRERNRSCALGERRVYKEGMPSLPIEDFLMPTISKEIGNKFIKQS